MFDESKLIFFSGAPGSKWSGVANIVSSSPLVPINITDRSDKRSYCHGLRFNQQSHLGAYWGPGKEFGKRFHEINKLSKDEILSECLAPFEDKETGYFIIKCHQFSYNLQWIQDNFPQSKIMVVYRPAPDCYKGWTDVGGINIPYPNYKDYYKSNEQAKIFIEKELIALKQWMFNNDLPIHIANKNHFTNYWGVDVDQDNNLRIKAVEGYTYISKNPMDKLKLDVGICYYNFDDIFNITLCNPS